MKGVVSIGALAADTGWSERHLTRVFIERTGLAPKLYARLTRFHAVLAAQARLPQASLSALALDGGYFDQAHFIRDCREFTGAAPRAFLADLAATQHHRR